MLSLGAVDVDGVVVRDGDHEHGVVAGLTLVVLLALLAVSSGRSSGVVVRAGRRSDGLEVAEDCILLGRARAVGVRRSNRVVLRKL